MPGLELRRRTIAALSLRFMPTACLVAATLGFSSCGSGGGSSTTPPANAAPIEILATGATVADFGTVGRGGVWLVGFDDAGRALLAGTLDDGRSGLFIGDGGALSTLWISGDGGAAIDPFTADISPAGRVAAVGPNAKSIAILEEGGWRVVLAAGDDNGAGETFCAIYELFINDSGGLAFGAYTESSGQPCGTSGFAIYALVGDTPAKVATPPPSSGEFPGYVNLVCIAADGSAVVTRHADLETLDVIAVGNGETRTLVARGGPSPSGTPLHRIETSSCNRLGEALFAAQELEGEPDISVPYGAYRTRDGGVIAVARPGDEVAPDVRLRLWPGFAYKRAINDAGDIAIDGLFSIGPSEEESHLEERVLLLRNDGGASIVIEPRAYPELGARYPTSTGPAMVNNARQLAVPISSEGGAHSDAILRWEDGTLTHIAGSGDASPAGGILLAKGIGSGGCIANDGSVAVSADAPNGHDGVLCGDTRGFRGLATAGDRAPHGETLASVYGSLACSFTDGGLVFAAGGLVWRSSAKGLEKLIGEGDATIEGEVLQGRVDLLGTNHAGRVVVGGYSGADHSYGYFRYRRGELSRIGPPFPSVGGDAVEVAYAIGVADRDEVVLVAVVDDKPGSTRLVLAGWRDGTLREVAEISDVIDLESAQKIFVKGRQVVLDAPDQSQTLRIDLDRGERHVLARRGTVMAGIEVMAAQAIDASASGDVLVALSPLDQQRFDQWTYAIVDRDGRARILDLDATSEPVALAANGALLTLRSEPPHFVRQHLELSGGLQGSSCP